MSHVSDVLGLVLLLALPACTKSAPSPAPAENPGEKVAASPPSVTGTPPPAPVPPTEGPPQIEFETRVINFGVVPEIEKRKTSIRFTNRGGSELVIDAVKSTCGCTAAEPRKRNYAAGEAGILDVEFDPSGSGEQEKKITVFTNAGNVELLVKAEVVAFGEMDPAILRVGALKYGVIHELQMKLTCSDPDFVIDSVTCTNPHLSARALPHEPGEPAVIELTLAPTAEWGSLFSWVAATVTARPRRDAEPITEVVRGRVQGQLFDRLAADPDTFRFGVKADEPFERTVTLTGTNGAAFSVVWAELYLDMLPGASLERRQPSPGVWELVLKATGSAAPGPARGRVVVETDVPGEERLVINVIGVTRDRFGR